MPDPRYPIGKFQAPATITPEQRQLFIQQIAEAPAQIRAAVEGMTATQLETLYRAGGWSVRQVVHHVADSHMNSYVRFRLALTEDEPTVKTYHEDRWAELSDARAAPIEVSLALLEALHRRWVQLLESLHPEDFQRTFRHPELGLMTLDRNLALYAWHGRHHTAHIVSVRDAAAPSAG